MIIIMFRVRQHNNEHGVEEKKEKINDKKFEESDEFEMVSQRRFIAIN